MELNPLVGSSSNDKSHCSMLGYLKNSVKPLKKTLKGVKSARLYVATHNIGTRQSTEQQIELEKELS